MKATKKYWIAKKTASKLIKQFSSYDGFNITTRGQFSAVLNFFNLCKNLHPYAIKINKTSILIDFEVKTAVIFLEIAKVSGQNVD